MSNENAANSNSDLDDKQYKEKYHRLREQHENDKRVLLAQFHYQTNTLQQQHQHQLQEHLKMVLAHQREQQHVPPNPIKDSNNELKYTIKNKEKKSAVASSAVKKHLQKFVIDRQKIKVMDNFSSLMTERSKSFQWSNVDESSESRDTSNLFHAVMQPYDDFPLRKTASEPNLKVKSRLKQKLSAEQRSSPLLTRRSEIKADLANRIKKKLSLDTMSDSSGHFNPESAPNSPPRAINEIRSSSVKSNTDSPDAAPYESSPNCDLYSSPSLPNISLALSSKQNNGLVYAKNKHRLPSPHEARALPSQATLWTSCMGQLNEIERAKLSAFQNDFYPEALQYDEDNKASPPGPIRSHQLMRPHKALSRTRSAPTTVSSQLQQHILQKKHQRMLQQQKQRIKENDMYLYPNAVPSDAERERLWRPTQNMVLPRHQEEPSNSSNPQASVYFLPFPYGGGSSKPQTKDDHAIPITPAVSLGNKSISVSSIAKNKGLSSRHEPLSITGHRSLARTQSSPATSFLKITSPPKVYRYTTGVAYSQVMLKHGCACGDNHIEHPGRIEAIWKRLNDVGLVNDRSDDDKCGCEQIEARKATTDELQLVHTEEHTLRYGTTSLARKELALGSKFIVLPCGGVGVDNGVDVDTVWNELETINAARMAVGCTVDLALLVAQKKLKNGFAIVRPPGHHAQKNLAMAFCYFNSVAVAARKLQTFFQSAYKRILIIDWDVHHCNGTQNIFYSDSSVLVISVHRYDNGNFFPGTGALDEVGADAGRGFNVNVGLSNSLDPPVSDADFLAVFRCIVMPIAHHFKPDFVFISSGFSSAAGHAPSVGGFEVTPKCFGFLTKLILQLAGGKVVMALEGGFDLNALCDCTEACIRALKEDFSDLPETILNQRPSQNVVQSMKDVMSVQCKHWKCLEPNHLNLSYTEWIREMRQDEACNAMALLSMQNHVKTTGQSATDLSKRQAAVSNRPEKLEVLSISQSAGEKPNSTEHLPEDSEDQNMVTIDSDDSMSPPISVTDTASG